MLKPSWIQQCLWIHKLAPDIGVQPLGFLSLSFSSSPLPPQLSLSLSCYALLGLISMNILPPVVATLPYQIFRSFLGNLLSADDVRPVISLTVSSTRSCTFLPRRSLNLVCLIVSYLQIYLYYNPVRSITRRCMLISQCNPSAIRCLIDVAKKRVTTGI